MKHKNLPLVVATGLGAFLALLPMSLASAATINLSASGSVIKGSIVSVAIYENSGSSPVNAAKATINYPANLLDYVSISNSSAFSVVAANSVAAGSISVDRGALPVVSGRQLVATVSFRAKADSGTAAISVAGGSILDGVTSAETYQGGSGVNVNLIPVPPPAPPPPPPDTTPPVITNVKVTAIGPKTATITWTTDEPSSSVVDYGFSGGYGVKAQDNNLVTNHSVALNFDVLQPATEMHFMVSSTDAAGNPASSKDQSFTTRGLTMALTVVDQHGKPLRGAKVELGNNSATTNDKGMANVSGLPAGKIRGTVTYRGNSTAISVTAATPLKDVKLTAQKVTVHITAKSASVLPFFFGLLLVVLVAFGAYFGWQYYQRNKRTKPPKSGASNDKSYKLDKGSRVVLPTAATPTKSVATPAPQKEEIQAAPTIIQPTVEKTASTDPETARFSSTGGVVVPTGMPRDGGLTDAVQPPEPPKTV